MKITPEITDKSTVTSDVLNDALDRIAKQTVSHGDTEAYICTLRLPEQFASDQHLANDIYKKIQSDFCKHVFRSTGTTPRYVTVKTANAVNPEYRCCLFTGNGTRLDEPEDYAEKGREISNGKCGQAGWGQGKLPLEELFRDGPRFTISPARHATAENLSELIPSLRQRLQEKAEGGQFRQRTIFVSKCKDN